MENPWFNSPAIAVLGTLFGALIGSGATLITTWINKRYESKQKKLELLVNTAIKNYTYTTDLVRSLDKENNAEYAPLDHFIIHWARLFDLLLDKKTTPDKLATSIKEVDDLKKTNDFLIEHFQKTKGNCV